MWPHWAQFRFSTFLNSLLGLDTKIRPFSMASTVIVADLFNIWKVSNENYCNGSSLQKLHNYLCQNHIYYQFDVKLKFKKLQILQKLHVFESIWNYIKLMKDIARVWIRNLMPTHNYLVRKYWTPWFTEKKILASLYLLEWP